MGCGSSKTTSPKAQTPVLNTSPVAPTVTGSNGDADIEKRLNQFTALSKVEQTNEAKHKDADFVPATNIQYEIPEAFKDKAPLVPVGFSTIKSLEPIKISDALGKDGQESATWIRNKLVDEKVVLLVDSSLSDGRGFQYTFNAEGAFESRALLPELRNPHLHFREHQFWIHKDKAYFQLTEESKPEVLVAKPLVLPWINQQFWGDYLFFVSEDGSLIRVQAKQDTVSEIKLSASDDKIQGFYFTSKGKLFTITHQGTLRNGLKLDPKLAEEMPQLQNTKSLALSEKNQPDFLFYLMKDLKKAYFLAVADDVKSGRFAVCLVNERLELLHMINFKKGGPEPKRSRPALIRESTWKEHTLVVSAREIFEIDLFLIAKNQIMHLQTFNTKGQSGADHLKSLEDIDGQWYLGGNSSPQTSTNNTFLRKLVWDSA